MQNDRNNDLFLYKTVAAAIFVVLVTLIILIVVSFSGEKERPADSTDQSESVPVSSDTSVSPETSGIPSPSGGQTSGASQSVPVTPTAPVTSASPVTSAAPVVTTPAYTGPKVDAPAANVSEDVAALLAKYPDTVLGKTEDAGPDYIGKFVFLGDSTTYGMRYYGVLNGGKSTKQVWTPSNGTLTLSQASFVKIWYPDEDTEITIEEALAAKKPAYFVITLGVNGVSFMKEDFFKSEYKKIIDSAKKVSPDTKIICNSIYPVAASYKQLDSINNEKIDEANRWILEVAAESGVKYIDSNSILRGTDGWLPESAQNGDGMHLTGESYQLVLNNLRTHAWLD